MGVWGYVCAKDNIWGPWSLEQKLQLFATSLSRYTMVKQADLIAEYGYNYYGSVHVNFNPFTVLVLKKKDSLIVLIIL